MTFNGNDYYGIEDYETRIERWDELTIADQIDAMNAAFEGKEGTPPDFDFDRADYYTISPNGDNIPW